MESNMILKDKISSVFIKYSIPAIIAMIITGMQDMIDGMFLGNFIGSNAMASVNIASPFLQFIIGVAMVISIGSQSHMGLKLGEKDTEKAQNTFKTMVIISIGMGILVTFIGIIFNQNIARMLGANDVLLADVSMYIKTISLFVVPELIMFLCGFTCRIVERPELYFRGSLISIFSNIILNYLLIAKLKLGIQGAAIATGLSYSMAIFAVIWPMINKDSVINIFKGRFDKDCIVPVLYNGSSEGVNSVSIATSIFLFNFAFMKIAGEDGVAAFSAINYIAHFGTLILFGISDGIGPIVSYNYGTGYKDRVNDILKLSYKVSIIVGTIVFILLFLFGKNLVTIFISDNPEIINLAANGAKLYAFAFIVNGFNIINSGYFTYIGRGRESIIIAASRGIVFITISIIVLPMFLGVNGIWLSVPLAEVITMIIGIILIKKYS